MNDIVSIVTSLLPGMSPLDAMLLFLLVLTRWLSMSITMPFLGSQLLPSAVRLALASVLSAVSFYLLFEQANRTIELNGAMITLLFVKEALLGFILGFLASLIFYAYELFGEVVDLTRAANMSRLLVPELKHQSTAMGVLLFQLSLVIFLGLGFHRDVIRAAYQSFETFPVFSLGPNFLGADFLSCAVSILAVLFEQAFRFALPIIVITFIIDLAFGLVNRVVPQINAYFLSLPAKMLGGLIMLLLILPFLLDDFALHYQELSRFFLFYVTKRPL